MPNLVRFACSGRPGCGGLDCATCYPGTAEWCTECDGTGEITFCPSRPDKCGGCEAEPCWRCGGHTRSIAVEPDDPVVDERLSWGGLDR